MKKIIALVLVALLVFSTVGCSLIKKDDTPTKPNDSSKKNEQVILDAYRDLYETENDKAGGYASGIIADFDDDKTPEILIISDIYRTVYETNKNQIIWVEDLSGQNRADETTWDVMDYLWDGKNVYMHRVSGEWIHIDGMVVGIDVQGELFVYENGQKKVLLTQRTTNDLYFINGEEVSYEEYEETTIYDYIPRNARYIEEYWTDGIVDLRKIR